MYIQVADHWYVDINLSIIALTHLLFLHAFKDLTCEFQFVLVTTIELKIVLRSYWVSLLWTRRRWYKTVSSCLELSPKETNAKITKLHI